MFPPTITNPWGESKFNLSCLTVVDQFFTSQASYRPSPHQQSFTLLRALGLRWWKRWRNDHRTLSDTVKNDVRRPRDLGFWTSNTSSSSVAAKPSREMVPKCALSFSNTTCQVMSIILWCWKILEHWKSLKTSWISLKGTSDTMWYQCLVSCPTWFCSKCWKTFVLRLLRSSPWPLSKSNGG
jgi:hypothetical protein